MTLKAKTKGEVFPTGSSQMRFKNQLTCRQTVGVSDTNGDPFRASLQREDNSSSPNRSFKTSSSGHFYLVVGPDAGDRTGVYTLEMWSEE